MVPLNSGGGNAWDAHMDEAMDAIFDTGSEMLQNAASALLDHFFGGKDEVDIGPGPDPVFNQEDLENMSQKELDQLTEQIEALSLSDPDSPTLSAASEQITQLAEDRANGISQESGPEGDYDTSETTSAAAAVQQGGDDAEQHNSQGMERDEPDTNTAAAVNQGSDEAEREMKESDQTEDEGNKQQEEDQKQQEEEARPDVDDGPDME